MRGHGRGCGMCEDTNTLFWSSKLGQGCNGLDACAGICAMAGVTRCGCKCWCRQDAEEDAVRGAVRVRSTRVDSGVGRGAEQEWAQGRAPGRLRTKFRVQARVQAKLWASCGKCECKRKASRYSWAGAAGRGRQWSSTGRL